LPDKNIFQQATISGLAIATLPHNGAAVWTFEQYNDEG